MKAVILPGLGANSNMYPKEKYSFLQDVIFINWPKYDGEGSLEEVAKKIIVRHRITSEMVVGGSSLGGMVAIEIAKILGNRKVILIGSATSPDFINPLLKKLSNLAEVTPIKIIQILTGKVNKVVSNDLLRMFEQSDSQFITAMCKALFTWEGLDTLHCEICHIHGERDLVIFPPKEGGTIIRDGGHLISLSHPEEVANFIYKNIQ